MFEIADTQVAFFVLSLSFPCTRKVISSSVILTKFLHVTIASQLRDRGILGWNTANYCPLMDHSDYLNPVYLYSNNNDQSQL